MTRTTWELCDADAVAAAVRSDALYDLSSILPAVNIAMPLVATRAAFELVAPDVEHAGDSLRDLAHGVYHAFCTVPRHEQVRVVRCCSHRAAGPVWVVLIAYIDLRDGWTLFAPSDLT